jgi:hypothetical protein
MDITNFPTHEHTQRMLSKVKDPLERTRHAHAIASDARKMVIGVPPRPRHPEDKGEPSELLTMRNEALLVLHQNYDWTKNRCAEEMRTDRRTINLPSGFSSLPADLDSELLDMSEEELRQRALEIQDEWKDHASIWRTATEIRDDLIHRLTSSSTAPEDGGQRWQNADIARGTGMSTSLVAQIRKGSMNKWKRENPEIHRERRRARDQRRQNLALEALEAAAQDTDTAPVKGSSAA